VIGDTLPVVLPKTGSGEPAPHWLQDFYDASLSSDPARLENILHPDVTWLISGPADQVDLFGMRRGRAEVLELKTRIGPCFQRLVGFDIEQVLVQGERTATFGRLRSLQRETRRPISFAFSHFMRFFGGQLVSMRAVVDSYDAVQQIFGVPLAMSPDAGLVPLMPGDIAMV
jgi:ketosteroid isomerase-like protein